MSMYNLGPSKSLKKLTDLNPKATHITPQSILQPSRQSSVNLSKLGAYKGKFSLTSKYNSLSSQNNNQQKHLMNEMYHKSNFMSESNKENMFGRANMIMQKPNDKFFFGMNQTDKIRFENVVDEDDRDDTKQNLNKNIKQNLPHPKYKLKLKTQPTHEESQEQTQNMKKIFMAASTINLKNSQPKKSVPVVNNKNPIIKNKPITCNNNKKKSIDQSKQKPSLKENNKNLSRGEKQMVGQRRSKFHKYDNSTDQNEFLVIDQDISQPTKSSIVYDKKPSIQKKPPSRQTLQKKQPKKPQQPYKIHTQTLKLHQLSIVKQQQQHQQQIQFYKQSLKHITYSMIKMISLIGKIDVKEGQGSHNERNLKIITQIRNEIFTLYNKELGKYVDKLKIREEIVSMAKEEEDFLKKSQVHVKDIKQQKGSHNYDNRSHHNPSNPQTQILILQSSQSSRYDYSISHQSSSQNHQQDSENSLFQEYQIHEPSCNQPSLNPDDSLNERDQNSGSENFFNFDSIKHIEIIPSGRNLLETFNNQHLCNQLQVIGNELIDELEESRRRNKQISDNYGGLKDMKHDKFIKKAVFEGSHEIDDMTLQTYEENLSYGMRQISIQEQQPLEQLQHNPSHICRKLFNQQQSALKNNKQNLSPINHLHSTTSILSYQNQPSLPTLLPEHYYEVVSAQQKQPINETSSNYLQLSKGDIIKLLRKVDTTRWIAELEDRIGFVDENSVIKRVKLVGKTARKSQKDDQRGIQSNN